MTRVLVNQAGAAIRQSLWRPVAWIVFAALLLIPRANVPHLARAHLDGSELLMGGGLYLATAVAVELICRQPCAGLHRLATVALGLTAILPTWIVFTLDDDPIAVLERPLILPILCLPSLAVLVLGMSGLKARAMARISIAVALLQMFIYIPACLYGDAIMILFDGVCVGLWFITAALFAAADDRAWNTVN